ncbi:MAG: hypothetical protein AAFR44_16630, partial [Pseudomonadota bacterium]
LISDRLFGHGADALCSDLRALHAAAELPVVILTDGADGSSASACLLAGADDVFDLRAGDAALFARIRSLLREAATRHDLSDRLAPSIFDQAVTIPWPDSQERGQIGWITTRRAAALACQTRLSAFGTGRIQLLDPTTILGRAAEAQGPDIYIIDQNLASHGSGLRLLSDLTARAHSRNAAVLVVMEKPDPEACAAGFDLGANGVVLGPPEPEELAARLLAILRRKRQRDRLSAALDAGLAQAVEDPLTGLQNRRSTLDRLAALTATGQSVGALMIDIDRFEMVD